MVIQHSIPTQNVAEQSDPLAGVLVVGNFLSASLPARGICEDLADRLSGAGALVIRTSAKPGRVARLLDMLSTVWSQRHRYEVAQVDVYSGPAFFWAEAVTWLLRRLDKPYILTLHGGNLPDFAHRWPGRVRRLLGAATLVTSPSEYLREAMQPYRAQIELLPNPIDLPGYSYRRRTSLRPQLVWLRAFHSAYNPAQAPCVLALLRQHDPAAALIMVGTDKGDGSMQAAQQVASELGVADAVEFVGGVAKTQVGAWMARGDIFINTTNIDNTPVSVIEAMACGLCVVSTNVGGIPYLLTHEQDALLVPPDDPAAMAAAVLRLLDEPALAQQLAANASQKVEQFDWSVILPRWQALLVQAMEED